jgi:hypothetical protein
VFARIIGLSCCRWIFSPIARREQILWAAGVAYAPDLGDDIGRPVRVLRQAMAAAEGPALSQ